MRLEPSTTAAAAAAVYALTVCKPFASHLCFPQVEHTRDVMSEVEAVSNQYEGLAVSCSQLYFALETLRDVHFLYHFSLRFFQDILAQVSCCGGAYVR